MFPKYLRKWAQLVFVVLAAMNLWMRSADGQSVQDVPQSGGAILPNGIELPAQWPPQTVHLSREPMIAPYLVHPPAVIPIDGGRQLFVDDFLIQTTSLRRNFHQPDPYAGNPVIAADQSWETAKDWPMAAPFSDGVWYDSHDQTYKMWYQCLSPRANKTQGFATCYAISGDGLHWSKPSLDVVPGTNIVLLEPRDSTVVWLDSDTPDPERRFKLFLAPADAEAATGDSVRYSRDGIHWGDPVAINHERDWAGDRTTVFYNPFHKVWVYSIRNHIAVPDLGRIRYYSEYPDLAAGMAHWKPTPWVSADRLDLHNPKFPDINPEIYNLDAVAYESLLVGLFSVWQGPKNKICDQLHIQKRNQVMLGFSRDGFHWDRPDRRPFLRVNETEGAWNWGNMQSAGGGFLVVGDKLFFYSSGRHRNDLHWDSQSSTGVFFLRRDGFASMDAGQEEGMLTTRPVRFTGQRLFVNLAATTGQLKVEILDAKGQPVAPFTAAECIPITGDSTKQAVRWKQSGDLSSLAGRAVRFRFFLTNGSLYSFWISPSSRGESHGYVAAGGPEFAGSMDDGSQPNPQLTKQSEHSSHP